MQAFAAYLVSEMICHPFPPVFDADSEILILGSFPSVKSRENRFYYGHPQNRFWRVIAAIYGAEIPQTFDEKTELLLKNHIALWDVLASCEITGSSDSSIKAAVPNDLTRILSNCSIRAIYTNGRTADKFYRRFSLGAAGREAVCLPSTSPANAAWSLESLIAAWKCIAENSQPPEV